MDLDEAIRTLRSLAAGLDPVSHKQLGKNSPYQHSKSLAAIRLLVELFDAPPSHDGELNPVRSGIRWTANEDHELTKAYQGGVNIAALAKRHLRAEGAIRSRLRRLVVPDESLPLTNAELVDAWRRFCEELKGDNYCECCDRLFLNYRMDGPVSGVMDGQPLYETIEEWDFSAALTDGGFVDLKNDGGCSANELVDAIEEWLDSPNASSDDFYTCMEILRTAARAQFGHAEALLGELHAGSLSEWEVLADKDVEEANCWFDRALINLDRQISIAPSAALLMRFYRTYSIRFGRSADPEFMRSLLLSAEKLGASIGPYMEGLAERGNVAAKFRVATDLENSRHYGTEILYDDVVAAMRDAAKHGSKEAQDWLEKERLD